MTNEEIVNEIQEATSLMEHTLRKVNSSLCNARNVIEAKDKVAVNSEAIDEAYHKGLNDAWNAVKHIILQPKDGGIDNKEFWDIFHTCSYESVLIDWTPEQVLEAMRDYDVEKAKIAVGDIVQTEVSSVGVVTFKETVGVHVMWADGSSGRWPEKKLKKTGKHINIQSLLNQVKE